MKQNIKVIVDSKYYNTKWAQLTIALINVYAEQKANGDEYEVEVDCRDLCPMLMHPDEYIIGFYEERDVEPVIEYKASDGSTLLGGEEKKFIDAHRDEFDEEIAKFIEGYDKLANVSLSDNDLDEDDKYVNLAYELQYIFDATEGGPEAIIANMILLLKVDVLGMTK
jgi:hypothetical protein